MPTYYLKIKADLENIEQLIPVSENLWKFDIQSNDGEQQSVQCYPFPLILEFAQVVTEGKE